MAPSTDHDPIGDGPPPRSYADLDEDQRLDEMAANLDPDLVAALDDIPDEPGTGIDGDPLDNDD